MIISTAERMLRLNLQFFGADGAGGAEGGTETNGETKGATNEQATQAATQENNALSTEAIEKYIQSQVDKQMAEERKKTANLQKELEKTKKEKMSAEEVQKYDLAEREKAMAEKEKALLERENRLFAIKAIKENGLDDGSQQSLELVDFVMGNDEDAITERVKAFKGLVDRFVSAKVEQTFRANGRNPQGASANGAEGKQTTHIAEQLGKQMAETNKQANNVLNYYLGGNK